MEVINKRIGSKTILFHFENGWRKAMYARNSGRLIGSK